MAFLISPARHLPVFVVILLTAFPDRQHRGRYRLGHLVSRGPFVGSVFQFILVLAPERCIRLHGGIYR